jgi:hypothetical protein
VPVPSGGTIALFPDKPILSCQVDLYDWLGESITHWSASGPYQPSWNVGGLAPGIYIARIKLILLDGSQETTLQKIVVAR